MANAIAFLTNRSADNAKSFAAGFAATDLTAVAGGTYPNYGPQYTEVHNANAAASQNAVVTLQNNTTFTVVLAPGETRPIPVPIKALQVSGADVSANCYWWIFASKLDEQRLPTLNP